MTTIENSYRGLSAAARLGANHGYRIQGDLACLNAELTIAHDARAAAREWALQLWACDSPYGGGALSGVKVAEAALDVAADLSLEPQRLYAETLARLPAAGRDYSMVLVLASGQAGSFDRVDDFANYPARERFVAPYLEGKVDHAIEGDTVVVSVEGLCNPRSADNLSGSLALELWALREPYAGGQFTGEPLAGVELGTLAGQGRFERIERRLTFRAPPVAALPQIVLMLREWNGDGYVTRDFRNLAAKPVDTKVAPVVEAKVAEAKVAEVSKTVATTAKPPAVAASATARLSIQTASVEQLSNVKGLNKKLAVEIVKSRPYRSLDDLVRVRGISDKLLRQIRDQLTV